MRRVFALALLSAAFGVHIGPAQAASSADRASVARSTGDFGAALYRRVRHGNTAISPFSMESALAGVYAGAQGATQREVRAAMSTKLSTSRFAAGLAAINSSLNAATGDGGDRPQISVANAFWADASTTPRTSFVDTVRSYGADVRTADFRGAAEAARQEINKWVSDRTNGRIPELFGAGAITAMTRLVIANAIYFKGRWENEFSTSATTSRPFHRAGASAVNVPTMHGSLEAGYTSAKDFQAVDLPYRGGRFSMLVILPRRSMSAVERRLSGAFLKSTADHLRTAMVKLALPRFEFRGSYALNAPLKKLGMKLAFDSRRANLGAMFTHVDGRPFISNAIHKTFIHVDEQGTEAAAATGIDVGTTAAPAKQVTLTVDRPFLAIIRDSGTGVPLFIVRVTDPRG